jgi:hypothetical protein
VLAATGTGLATGIGTAFFVALTTGGALGGAGFGAYALRTSITTFLMSSS